MIFTARYRDGSARRAIKPRNQAQRRCLARTLRPQQADDLRLVFDVLHGERQAFQRKERRAVIHQKRTTHVFELEQILQAFRRRVERAGFTFGLVFHNFSEQ